MSNIKSFVEELSEQGVVIDLDGESLRFSAPKERLTREIKNSIKARKNEVIEYLLMRAGERVVPLDTSVTSDRLFEVSHAQRSFWAFAQLHPQSCAYNVPLAISLRGELEKNLLQQAFVYLVSRHEILRTVFVNDEGQPKQKILPFNGEKISRSFIQQDVPISDNSPSSEILALLEKESRVPLDLLKGPLCRPKLLCVNSCEHVLLLTMHHIITDGWSTRLFLHELFHVYSALQSKSPITLPALEIQYKDFSAWQNQRLREGLMASSRDYWLQQLAGPLPSLDLPKDHPRPALQGYSGAESSCVLSSECALGLKRLSNSAEVSMFVTVVALLKVLLFRYTQQQDIIVGIPMACRQPPELEQQLGLYINTLPLRTGLNASMCFAEVIEAVKVQVLDAYEHQSYPFDTLVDDLALPRDLSRSPVFDVMIIHQDGGDPQSLGTGELEMSILPLPATTSKYDLTIHVQQREQQLHVSFEYNCDLFSAQRIQRMGKNLQCLANAVLALPGEPIAYLPMLDAQEQSQIVAFGSGEQCQQDNNITFLQDVSQQCECHPEKTALIFTEPNEGDEPAVREHYSYQDLAQQSETIAYALANKGVGRGDIVAMCTARSANMLVGLLGILKTGAAYLPIDPDYPQERIDYMLSDSGARLVLDEAALASMLIAHQQPQLREQKALCGVTDTEQCAYVIYTSGSSGEPKGVSVSHGALMNFLRSMAQSPGMTKSDRLLAVTTICFDIAALELFLPLLSGACVVMTSRASTRDARSLATLIQQQHITVLQATPSTWRSLLAVQWPGAKGLKALCGGEALSTDVARALLPKVASLWNLYGPTETTIWSSVFPVTDIGADTEAASQLPAACQSIGQPIHQTQFLVLDLQQQLCPLACPGELYIGGRGLALGYHKRPQLSAEKFINTPAHLRSICASSRLYRSGDLVCLDDNGNFNYLERLDNQVKIRGFRVELGEIEALLESHSAVRQALVLMNKDVLVAYIVGVKERTQDTIQLLDAALREKLPEYMIPVLFQFIDELPLTANGKIDRKALATLALPAVKVATQGNDNEASHGVLGPSVFTPLQVCIAELWQSVLGLSKVDLEDNFFRLGGNSIHATELVFAIEKKLSVGIALVEVFKAASFADFCTVVQSLAAAKVAFHDPIIQLPQADETQGFALSHGQRRLWLLHEIARDKCLYNVPVAIQLRLRDVAADFEQYVKAAIKALISRYEILRTVFRSADDVLLQYVRQTCDVPIALYKSDALESDIARHIESQARCAFSLSEGPLLRFGLIQQAPTEFVLYGIFHHIVCDEWSLNIMLNDVRDYLDAVLQGQVFSDTDLTLQYKDFSAWQNARLHSPAAELSKHYWLRQFAKPPAPLDLQFDIPRPKDISWRGETFSFVLDQKVKGLSALDEAGQSTDFMVLYCLVAILLSRHSGQNDLVIGTPVAGREHPDLKKQVGFFVNTLALRVALNPEASFLSLLDQVKANCVRAYEHQSYPFDRLVDDVALARDSGRTPLFDVLISLDQAPLLKAGKALTTGPFGLQNHTAKFDLSFYFTQTHEGVKASINYRCELFSQSRIARLAAQFNALIHAIIDGPEQPIESLDILPLEEKTRLLEWQGKIAPPTEHIDILTLFERQLKVRPYQRALSCHGHSPSSYSYRDLNAMVDALALHLVYDHALKPGEKVAVLFAPNEWAIVSFLAVLKAGATYVPIDPSYPVARIQFTLRDCDCRLALCDEPSVDVAWKKVPAGEQSPRFIVINKTSIDEAQAFQLGKKRSLSVKRDIEQAAYVIYTSGSSGQPKGCAISHKNVLSLLHGEGFPFDFNERDIWVCAHSLCFDFSVWEMYGALVYGGTLVMAGRDIVSDPKRFRQLLIDEKVTVLNQTPAAFYNLLEQESVSDTHSLDQHLRMIIFGGDSLALRYLKRWKDYYSTEKISLVNMYGITETTVHLTYGILSDSDIDSAQSLAPVGVPLPDRQIYVCDGSMKIQPIGVAGEIYVGGSGVGLGYINRASIERTRFIEHTFDHGSKIPERLYRTGDVGYWQSDGRLMHLGRNDKQIQMRGYRIELQEIASVINRYPGVKQAVVIPFYIHGSVEALHAYVTADISVKAATGEIKAFVQQYLPAHMQPSHILYLPDLPLTVNGKLDESALPDPRKSIPQENDRQITATEQYLQKLWQQLLALPQVSCQQNFFESGGHSLTAVQLCTRIKQQLSVSLSIRDIFQFPVLAELAQHIDSFAGAETIAVADLPKAPVQDAYPLSKSQHRLWTMEQLGIASGVYNIFSAYRIEGALNLERLERALLSVVNRHNALRTRILCEDESPRQIIQAQQTGPVLVYGAGQTSTHTQRHLSVADIEERCQQDARYCFDLERGPLYRFCLYQHRADIYVLTINLHHIIADGWSLQLLYQEILADYQHGGVCSARDDSQRRHFSDYVYLLEQKSARGDLEEHKAYWQRKLQAPLPTLILAPERARKKVKSYSGGIVHFSLSPAAVCGIRALAASTQQSVFCLLLSVVKTLLFRYTQSADIIVGTPMAERPHPQLEQSIGYYLNMLAIRSAVGGDQRWSDLFSQVSTNVEEALLHSEIPFDDVVHSLALERDPSRSPVFDVAVSMLQDAYLGAETDSTVDGLRIAPFELSSEVSRFDLTFYFADQGLNTDAQIDGQISAAIEYCAELFDRPRIERMAQHINILLNSIIANPDSTLAELRLLSDDEKQELLCAVNPRASACDKDRSLGQLFDLQCQRAPDKIAIYSPADTWSYQQLHDRAEQIAQYLYQHKNITAGDRIGVLFRRSPAAIAAVLAVVKLGAVYVPLDSRNPSQRLAFICQDANIRQILCSEEAGKNLDRDLQDHALCINEAFFNRASASGSDGPAWQQFKQSAESPIYIIYTSGSTGQPKGTVTARRSIARLIFNTNYISIDRDDCILQTGSLAFDASTFELWGALLNGACLALPTDDMVLEARELKVFAAQARASIMFLTTSLMNQYVDSEIDVFRNFRVVMSGGERASVQHFNRLRAHCPEVQLKNMYGPTENTTFSTWYDVEELHQSDIPIGRAISNTCVYVVDPAGNPVPFGVAGEIVLGGDGVALGYLNLDEKTASCFIKDRFADPDDACQRLLYRSGDMGMWQSDGQLLYLGRIDKQVKIRGYRVEPEELEQSLLAHPAVDIAVAMAQRNEVNTHELVSWVQVNKTIQRDQAAAQLRDYLRQRLPSYLIPVGIYIVNSFPLNRNFKIDRQALLALRDSEEHETAGENSDLCTPALPDIHQSKTVLQDIWSSVLACSTAQAKDSSANFFALGGDSIKAIQIASRLYKRGYELKVKQLFEFPTIDELVPLMVARTSIRNLSPTPVNTASPPPSYEPEQELLLSPIQHWFFRHYGKNAHHFNQSVLLQCRSRLNDQRVQQFFDGVLHHQENLRSLFPDRNGKIEAVLVDRKQPADFIAVDLRHLSSSEKAAGILTDVCSAVQKSFNVHSGPLLKVRLLRLADADHLFIVAHHLIIDGVSWRLLLDELRDAAAWLSDTRGREEHLHGFTQQNASYRQWTAYVAQYCRWLTEENNHQADYWQRIVEMPSDFSQKVFSGKGFTGRNLERDAARVTFSLTKVRTDQLLRQSHQTHSSKVEDVLLASLSQSLYAWRDISCVHIALEGHGREQLHAAFDHSSTMGWFTALYPCYITRQTSSTLQLNQLRKTLQALPHRGVAYGVLSELSPEHAALADFRCPISFNYLGQFSEDSASFFRFSPLDKGRDQADNLPRQYLIDVNGIVLEDELHVSISYPRDMLGEHSAKALTQLVDIYRQQLEDAIDRCLEVEDGYPLSPTQQGMLFETLMRSESRAYHVQMCCDIHGDIDVDMFFKAWDLLSERHGVLRSRIEHEGLEEAVQVICRQRRPQKEWQDVSNLSDQDQKAKVAQYCQEDIQVGFDLQRDNLMRLQLFKCGRRLWRLVWSYPHLLLDGWSIGLLQWDLQAIYRQCVHKECNTLMPAPAYRDYIDWIQDQEKTAAQAFWRDYLQGYSTLASLPGNTLAANSAAQRTECFYSLGVQNTQSLQDYSKAAGVSLNSIFQALWAVLLMRYNQLEDVVFGSVVSGRPPQLNGVEAVVGLFINTIPCRVKTTADMSLATMIESVQMQSLSALPFHYLSLAEIKNCSDSNSDLFDHLLIFENYPQKAVADTEETEQSTDEAWWITGMQAHDHTHYDVNIVVIPGEDISLKFSFNQTRYSSAYISRVAKHFTNIIQCFISKPESRMGDFDILDKAERQQVLETFNPQMPSKNKNTAKKNGIHSDDALSDSKTILQWLALRANQQPESIALRCNDECLNYRDLGLLSDEMANYLRHHCGLQPGERVAIVLDRSLMLLPSVLAIMKLGCSYIPIELDLNPGADLLTQSERVAERLSLIISTTSAPCILASPRFRCFDFLSRLCRVHWVGDKLPLQRPYGAGEAKVSPAYLKHREVSLSSEAYVIFTSGSTGVPKACALSHGNLSHYIEWAQRYYLQGGCEAEVKHLSAPLNDPGHVGLYSSLGFDLTVTSLFLPLVAGKSLTIYPQSFPLLDILSDMFSPTTQINLVKLTPSHITLLGELKLTASNVDIAIVGGEALSQEHIDVLHRCNPDMLVVNEYGPTETTVGCVCKVVSPQENSASIGRPIDNTAIYIVDTYDKPVPVGVIGEIIIAGRGVATGYLDADERTAVKFSEDTLGKCDRVYRSGDIGRWLENGEIEYLGRRDSQVKVRGHRLELGEVTRYLLQVPAVQEATALLVEGRGLVAFYRHLDHANSDAIVTRARDVRQGMSERCPEYMWPDYWVELGVFPVTKNGKMDEQALLDHFNTHGPLDLSPRTAETLDHMLPASASEASLLEIFADVLQVSPVNRVDNFFELGGHSLKAMQVLARIRSHLKCQVSLPDFFANPSVAQLMNALTRSEPEDIRAIEAIGEHAHYPLSYAQQRIWLQHMLKGGDRAYNMPSVHTLPSQVDTAALVQAFNTVIERHEILRTAFISFDGEIRQVVLPQLPMSITQKTLQRPSEANRHQEINRQVNLMSEQVFDLTKPPLLSAQVLNLGEGDKLLLFVMHHILGDGWSSVLLHKEITQLYTFFSEGGEHPLEALQLQYKDYAHWQRQQTFTAEADYWKQYLQDMPQEIVFNPLYETELQRDFSGGIEYGRIPPEQVIGLQTLARQYKTTLSNICLSALGLFIHQWTSQDDFCIGLSIAGRNHLETEKLIGFFVNVLPIRMRFDEGDELERFIKSLVSDVEMCMEHSEYPFDLLVRDLNPTRKGNRQPLVNVLYAYQNYYDVQQGVQASGESSSENTHFDDLNYSTAKFDLTLFLVEQDGLKLGLEYNSDLFDPTIARSMVKTYLAIMETLNHERSNTVLLESSLK